MSIEIIFCKVCRRDYDADSNDLGTYKCPHCNKPQPVAGPKPLDKVFETLMPFGRHRGEPFYKIPDAYLEWLETELLTNKEASEKNAVLLSRITAEIKRRKDNPKARV